MLRHVNCSLVPTALKEKQKSSWKFKSKKYFIHITASKYNMNTTILFSCLELWTFLKARAAFFPKFSLVKLRPWISSITYLQKKMISWTFLKNIKYRYVTIMKQRTGNLGLKAYLKLNCLSTFSGCFLFKIKKSILLKNQKNSRYEHTAHKTVHFKA